MDGHENPMNAVKASFLLAFVRSSGDVMTRPPMAKDFIVSVKTRNWVNASNSFTLKP